MTAPRIRAGDSDRQKSVDRLARHFTQGRLDSNEYDERVRHAYASVYLDELPALFTDLPPESISVQAYDRAWRQGYGPIDRHSFSGLRYTRPPRRRVPRILAFTLLAMVVVSMVAVTHGFFFPFPLIWIGLFGLTAGRHGHRWTRPGPRR